MERKANRSLQKLLEPQGGKGERLEAAGLHAHLQCGMHIYITCIEQISIWGEVEKLRGHHLHGGGGGLGGCHHRRCSARLRLKD